jgi:hypothetical protein
MDEELDIMAYRSDCCDECVEQTEEIQVEGDKFQFVCQGCMHPCHAYEIEPHIW